MVVLRINNTDLPTGWTHEFTDWQISTSEDFSNIILSSMNDSVNLYTLILNENLEFGVTYYARARMLLNTGFTEWSNIDIFSPKDIDETSLLMDIPSIITAPTLMTKYDKNAHPSTYFKVYITNGFSTLGNATHESTTWVIEDIAGKPIWASIDDKENLLELDINFKLPLNNFYRVHASLKGTNGDISQFGTVTFYASDDKLFLISRYIYRYDLNIDVDIIHPFIVGLDYMEYEVYSDGNIIHTDKIIDEFFTIDHNILDDDKINLVKIRTEVNTKYRDYSYIFIVPYGHKDRNENDYRGFPLKLEHKF